MKRKKIKHRSERPEFDPLEDNVSRIQICPGPLQLKTDVKTRLRNNIEILRALEKEWEDANKERQIRNAKLEAEGHETLEQKVKALHDKLAKEQGAIPPEFLNEDGEISEPR